MLDGSGTMQGTAARTLTKLLSGGDNGWFLQELWHSAG
jgi:hypothetical protein